MPQLDSVAYVSEVFWLVTGFILMYFLLLNSGLSTLHKVLKFRRSLLEITKTGVVNLKKESFCIEVLFKHMGYSLSNELKPISDSLFRKLDLYVVNYSKNIKKLVNGLVGKRVVLKINNESYGRYSMFNLVGKINYIKDKKSINSKIIN